MSRPAAEDVRCLVQFTLIGICVATAIAISTALLIYGPTLALGGMLSLIIFALMSLLDRLP
jgi:hypothetical protein